MSAVFSIDKKRVRQSFASAADTYDGLATLQRQVGHDLLAMFEIAFTDNIVMDIGCGTGFMTKELMLTSSVQKLFAVDIAYSMLEAARLKLKDLETVHYICADAEFIPLQKQAVNKIVSNLALQWCQNLTQVFEGFNHGLKPGGQLVFSTFGPATLQELKQAWSEVDDYTHVNEFYTVDEITIFLQQAGFGSIQIESKCYQSNYQAVIDLMRELKGIGAKNMLSGRNKKTTSKAQMEKMVKAYEKYRINKLIPATYEIIFVSAGVTG